jgi:hypothetical protein
MQEKNWQEKNRDRVSTFDITNIFSCNYRINKKRTLIVYPCDVIRYVRRTLDLIKGIVRKENYLIFFLTIFIFYANYFL